jgi:hypothetical protein
MSIDITLSGVNVDAQSINQAPKLYVVCVTYLTWIVRLTRLCHEPPLRGSRPVPYIDFLRKVA